MSTAYRGHARVFLKDLEAIRPSAIIDIIHSGESFVLEQSVQKGMKAMREYPPTFLSSISICSRNLPYAVRSDGRGLLMKPRDMFEMRIYVI